MNFRLVSLLLSGCTVELCRRAPPTYPVKTVRIVVPFAAGGSTDLLARNIAQRLNEAWKQPVIVDNRAGGGGIVGSEHVVKSPPDGYTLLVGTVTTHAVSASLYRKLPVRSAARLRPDHRDRASFRRCCRCTRRIPVRSVKELVALAKARPGELNYGTAGAGSASHMAMELFQSMAKVKMVHVPYKGTGPALTDLLGGHLGAHVRRHHDLAAAHADPGSCARWASAACKRSPITPDVPTIAESGYPGLRGAWSGSACSRPPARRPTSCAGSTRTRRARCAAPKMREILASQGLEVVAGSPADFGKRVAAEIAQVAQGDPGGGHQARLLNSAVPAMDRYSDEDVDSPCWIVTAIRHESRTITSHRCTASASTSAARSPISRCSTRSERRASAFHKVPSTPHDPSEAIERGIADLLQAHRIAPARGEPRRSRHDRRDQPRDRAQGRADGAHHDQGLSRRAGDRAPDAAAPLRLPRRQAAAARARASTASRCDERVNAAGEVLAALDERGGRARGAAR